MHHHTPLELVKMRGAMKALRWSSFYVNYSDAGCNDDMHGSGVVYIHAMPDALGQQLLMKLTLAMNRYLSPGSK